MIAYILLLCWPINIYIVLFVKLVNCCGLYTQQTHIHPILVCVYLVLSHMLHRDELSSSSTLEKMKLGPIRCRIYLKSSAMQI